MQGQQETIMETDMNEPMKHETLLMTDTRGNELSIELVSAAENLANGDELKLLRAKTKDGRKVRFDQMQSAWVIEETDEPLTPVNSKL
jgi:hypothetical protein